ncbi:MAG: sugar ABC transporter substrate-binding protein [candidate division FCPU426 bacterium]
MLRKIIGTLFFILLGVFMLAVWFQNYYFVNEVTSRGLTLQVWNKPPSRQEKEAQLWKENILRFEQEEPDIKINSIEREFSPQEFVTAMAGGKGPDVMHIWVGTLSILARQGFITPMDDYLVDWDQRDYIPKSVWEPTQIDGKTYGVPRDTYFTVLFYRKDLFREAGLDPEKPPKNWEELVEFAKLLTVPAKGQYGLGLPSTTWDLMDFVWQNGGELVQRDPRGQWQVNLASPEVIQTLQFWRDLRREYHILPPNTLASHEDISQMFALGKVAMMTGVAIQLPVLINKYGLDFSATGVAPLPAGPDGVRACHAGGEVYIINAQIPKARRDAAWKYIRFELSPATQLWKWVRMNELKMTIFPGAFSASTNLLNLPEFAMVKEELQYVRNEPLFPEWTLIKDSLDRDLLQALMVDPALDLNSYVQTFNLKVNEQFFPLQRSE